MPLTPRLPPRVFSLFSPGPALVVWKALGARRSALALRPGAASPLKMDGFGLDLRPASRIMSFFCNQYSQKRRCFKESSFFFFGRRLDRKCCRSGSCRNNAAPYFCTKHPDILHNLRSHLDFLGLSDYILSNLAAPSNQHQLHLFNHSNFPLKGGGRKNTKHSL